MLVIYPFICSKCCFRTLGRGAGLFYKNIFTHNTSVHLYSHKQHENSSLVIWFTEPCCPVNFYIEIYAHTIDSNILHSYPKTFATLWGRQTEWKEGISDNLAIKKSGRTVLEYLSCKVKKVANSN